MAVLQVNAHRDVLDDDGARRDAELADYLRGRAAAGDLELHVHDFLPDQDLWAYLSSLDVSVLPYRFGTHSGWLEACRDLGTTVVAPDVRLLRLAGPGARATSTTRRRTTRTRSPPRSGRPTRRGPTSAASVQERRLQRREIADVHEAIYLALAGEGGRMRICLIASSRYPIREPFAGGLEAITHALARELVRRGHEISVFAAPGSDPGSR